MVACIYVAGSGITGVEGPGGGQLSSSRLMTAASVGGGLMVSDASVSGPLDLSESSQLYA